MKDIYEILHTNSGYFARYEQTRMEEISNILYLFISAHLHAQLKIPYYFGDNPSPDTIEQAEVVLESNDLVKLATTYLLDQQDTLLEYRKSKDKALQILSLFEAMLVECKEEAVITNYDLYHFQASIKKDRIALEKLFIKKNELKVLEKDIINSLSAVVGTSSPMLTSILGMYVASYYMYTYSFINYKNLY